MKIFALYFKVELTKKPEWFEEFREKYQGTVGSVPHITLIQPRLADEADISVIKAKIVEVMEKHAFAEEDRNIVFDELVSGPGEDGNYLYMLMARRNDRLMDFQKNLRDALADYENYYADIMKEYETNFRPHLTLGNGVSPDQKEEADAYFKGNYACEGRITDLVMPSVKEMTVEEADDPGNLTIFAI